MNKKWYSTKFFFYKKTTHLINGGLRRVTARFDLVKMTLIRAAKKYFIVKEGFLATILILLVTFVISFFPFKYEFTRPIRQGFLGFDLYDIIFSGRNLQNTKHDRNIILVQIADTREEIAGQIDIIEKYNPAVIGVDAIFEHHKDPSGDMKLVQAISHARNIVFASTYKVDGSTQKPILVRSFFEEKGSFSLSGYTNFLGNPYSVIRSYPPFYESGDTLRMAFTSTIAKKFSPAKFQRLKDRRNESEIISYKGNLESYTSITKDQLALLATSGQLRGVLSGKIVLLGYFVKDKPLVMDDLYFSGLNEQVAGKSFPDMYSVVVEANILSMILDASYVNQASDLAAYFIAGLVVFLFLLFILSRYRKSAHPKHTWFLLLQLFLIVALLFIFLNIFAWYHIKIPPLPVVIALVLSIELLGVYMDIALWLHRKYQFKTVFKQFD